MKYSFLIFVILGLYSCTSNNGFETYMGQAQGTTFLIKYESISGEDYEDEVDSILIQIDNIFSTYIDESLISKFNNSTSGIKVNPMFRDLWEKCWEINIESDGYFDPTLSPVFKVYEEMPRNHLDSGSVAEALSHTGMPLLSLKDDSLIKKNPKLRLELNAIAQGYTVDIISDFLISKKIKNFMVEIGGEVYANGKNDKKKTWTIGIDKPIDGQRKLIAKVKLDGIAMATSGNYRKFEEIDGQRMGHIIDPTTGYPATTNILSVSVLTRYCYRADALATALMNRTSDEIKEFDQNTDDVEIFMIELIEGDTSIYVSPELIKSVDY